MSSLDQLRVGQCATITFGTSGSAACPATKFAGGQCRHEQVCIVGFGANLVCKSGCFPQCGQSSTLTASVSAVC